MSTSDPHNADALLDWELALVELLRLTQRVARVGTVDGPRIEELRKAIHAPQFVRPKLASTRTEGGARQQ